MEVKDMIWAVYEKAEDEDPVAVFAAPWHADAFSRLKEGRVVGRLDNAAAVRVPPSRASDARESTKVGP